MTTGARRHIDPTTRPTSERLHDSVAREIGIAIVAGQYRPGDILPGEHAASQKLQVSRPAYREALRMLGAKGLVQSRPKTGTRVTERDQWNLLDPDVLGWILENGPEPQFLNELFELRMIVEPAVAALAAERRTEAHLALIADALTDMAAHEHDSPAGQAADGRFHKALLAAGGNEILNRLASIIAASVDYVAEFKRERQVPRDPLPDHQALYAAIEARKPNAARRIMMGLISHARSDTVIDD